MTRVVLAEAYRTPIGVFGGAFKDILRMTWAQQ